MAPPKKTPLKKTSSKKKPVKKKKKPIKKAVKATGAAPKKRKVSRRKPVKKRQKSRVIKTLIKWSVVAGIWGMLFLMLLVAWYAYTLPDLENVKGFEKRPSIIVEDINGHVIGRSGGFAGDVVSVKDLPSYVPAAVLSIEDRRFYDHIGVDFIGLARAMWTNLNAGRFAQGGSTITQQLAKNLYLTSDKKLSRKFQELILAFWLEHELTKDEILTAYLNRVYFGAGAYGIDEASRRYFKKPAANITLSEAAMLAGLLKAPSRYSPLSNPKKAEKRMKTVLSAMQKAGYISEKNLKKALHKRPQNIERPATENPNKYFTDWVIDRAGSFIGMSDRNITIKTSFDGTLQKQAQTKMETLLSKHAAPNNIGQVAVVVMDMDGAVRAMIGGRHYKTSQFNRVTQAKRQTGSVFKPFVYLAALEDGFDPRDKILDAPLEEGDYRPRNFNDKYSGDVTLSTALARSMNTATLRLANKVGLSSILDVAARTGLQNPKKRDMSLVLGTGEQSLLNMTASYTVLANGGNSVFPYAIFEISDQEGDILYRHDAGGMTRQFLSKDIRNIQKMLHDTVESGTGKKAWVSGITKGGKTGTTQNFRDAWFIGYTENLVAGVWMGNDNNAPMKKVTGGGYPAILWRDIMRNSAVANKNKAEDKTSSPFSNLLKGLLD